MTIFLNQKIKFATAQYCDYCNSRCFRWNKFLLATIFFLIHSFTTTSLQAEPERALDKSITIKKSSLDSGELPSFLLSSETSLSENEQRQGRMFITTLRQHNEFIDDPIIHDYVNSLGYLLVNHAQFSYPEFYFFVLDYPSINAFAGPAMQIGLHLGLIQVADSEGELASVLAHEIAHVKQQHLQRIQNTGSETAFGNPLLIASIMLAGVLTNHMDIAVAGSMMMAGRYVENQLSHSRQFEQEADTIGLNILQRAGFSGKNFSTFLRKLLQGDTAAKEFLRSHPLPMSRIVDMENRLKSSAETVPSKSEFFMIQAYLYWLTGHQPNQLKKEQQAYLKFLQLIQQQDWTNALTYWKTHPQLHDYLTTKLSYLKLLTKTRKYQQAQALASNLQIIHPYSLPLVLLQNDLLGQQKKYQQANHFLLSILNQQPSNNLSLLWKAVARNYDKLKNHPESSYAKAKQYFYQGYLRKALGLMDQAIKLSEAQNSSKAVLNWKRQYNQWHQDLYGAFDKNKISPHQL